MANTPLQAGQVTARGIVYLASNLNPIETRTFAITGGTAAYTTVRGQLLSSQRSHLFQLARRIGCSISRDGESLLPSPFDLVGIRG